MNELKKDLLIDLFSCNVYENCQRCLNGVEGHDCCFPDCIKTYKEFGNYPDIIDYINRELRERKNTITFVWNIFNR